MHRKVRVSKNEHKSTCIRYTWLRDERSMGPGVEGNEYEVYLSKATSCILVVSRDGNNKEMVMGRRVVNNMDVVTGERSMNI